MKHTDLIKKMDRNVHGAYVRQMFLIAMCMESKELRDMIAEIRDAEWKKLFPDCNYGADMQYFCDTDKFGFIAEIHIPEHYGFVFHNGTVIASQYGGVHYIQYVYAETITDLYRQIEKLSAKFYAEDLQKAKKKTAQPAAK